MRVNTRMRLSDLFEEHWKDYEADREYWRELSGSYTSRPDWAPEFTSWPPPPAELKTADRAICQNPQWLAYYAYFGWASWSRIPDKLWRFDKERVALLFHDVPRIGHGPNLDGGNGPAVTVFPDRSSLYVDLNGKVSYRRPSPYDQYYIFLPSAVEACRQFTLSIAPRFEKYLKYLTGDYYIRFGKWPKNERSQNFLATRLEDRPVFEDGVSVYHAFFDENAERWQIDPTVEDAAIAGTLQSLIYSDSEIYLVQGDEIDKLGADGEPLLHNVEIIKQLKTGDVFVEGMFDPLND